MKTLRLLMTEDCNRSCEGCCNKDWDLDNLPVETDFTSYDEVIITGGEPMLYFNVLENLIYEIRLQNPEVKIIVYTAKTNIIEDLLDILGMEEVDGLTVTIHDLKDLINFISFDMAIPKYLRYKSLYLNMFEGIIHGSLNEIYKTDWKIKDNVKWIKNCPLPENEVFKRM